jgi:hypothetical protein
MTARTHSGLSYAEIGKLLGMSRQNAELIGTRALNKLRAAVGSKYRGPWIPYDSEGVPEAEGDTRDYVTPMRRQRRTRHGLFVRSDDNDQGAGE